MQDGLQVEANRPLYDHVVGPFDFWSAGTDNGVPKDAHWRIRPGLLMTIAALVVIVILLAVFVDP